MGTRGVPRRIYTFECRTCGFQRSVEVTAATGEAAIYKMLGG